MTNDREFAALAAWSRAVLLAPSEEVLPSLGRTACDILGCDHLWLRPREGGPFCGTQPNGPDQAGDWHGPDTAKLAALETRLTPQDPVAKIPTADAENGLEPALPPEGAWLGGRLGREEAALGYIHLFRHGSPFTARDELVLGQLCATATLAMENAHWLEAAKAAELRLSRFLDSSLDMLCTITSEGKLSEMSANSTEILGYAPSEMIGRPYLDFVHPHDLERTLTEQGNVSEGQASKGFVKRYLRKDGGVVHLHWSASFSLEEDCFYCVVRDMTALVGLESRLNRAQRLEAVGQLTGGLAHDFNNLLTIILGSTEALIDRCQESPDLLELAELTRAAGERGAELTTRLLAFARRQPLRPERIVVHELIESLESLLRRSIGAQVDMRLVLSHRDLACEVDPAQLESALLNLCINARDAMRGGGTLLLESYPLELTDAFASRQDDLPAGSYAVIAVSDTGAGMSPDTAQRAFEPFFTTKDTGKGSGLGLSMVYGFIKQSGGTVKIYSEEGRGTTVKLYLPRSYLPAEAKDESDYLAIPSGAGRILAVEDDALLRTQVVRQLKALGYSVTAASNGKEALGLLQGGEAPFDLLFSDIVMPGGFSGRQLADRARRLYPRMKVVLTSGYTPEAIALKGDGADYPLLGKPYRKAELARAIAQALGQST